MRRGKAWATRGGGNSWVRAAWSTVPQRMRRPRRAGRTGVVRHTGVICGRRRGGGHRAGGLGTLRRQHLTGKQLATKLHLDLRRADVGVEAVNPPDGFVRDAQAVVAQLGLSGEHERDACEPAHEGSVARVIRCQGRNKRFCRKRLCRRRLTSGKFHCRCHAVATDGPARPTAFAAEVEQGARTVNVAWGNPVESGKRKWQTHRYLSEVAHKAPGKNGGRVPAGRAAHVATVGDSDDGANVADACAQAVVLAVVDRQASRTRTVIIKRCVVNAIRRRPEVVAES